MSSEIRRESVQQWLIQRIATESELAAAEIRTDVPFSDYSLDSVIVVTIAVDLESWLKISVDPTVFWEFDSIDALSEWLIKQVHAQHPST